MKAPDEKQVIVDAIMALRAIIREPDDAAARAQAEALVDKLDALEEAR